jgi:hypothetical protein
MKLQKAMVFTFGFPSALFLIALLSCGPVSDPRGASDPDLSPPCVESVRSIGPRELELVFDEEAQIQADKLRFTPELTVSAVPGPAVVVVLEVGDQTPGRKYAMEAVAGDAGGNTVSFTAEFYGFNPNVPRVVLNELSPRGSETHPDMAELKILSDGDMGGVVIYQGTPGSFADKLIFPSFRVRAGEFILVHFKPTGDPSERDETEDKNASGGLDAAETAFDFWVPDAKGLGGNNGVLSIYERPGGKILDGVLYSNRISSSDEAYRGFGSSAMLAKADEIVRDAGWKTSGTAVAPEDAVNPDGSTATRSICRSSASLDTDGRADWHIVPTKKSTFGAENSDEVYVP